MSIKEDLLDNLKTEGTDEMEVQPWLGTFDWIVIVAFTIGVAYWLYSRRKPAEVPYSSFRPINGIPAARQEDTSFVTKMKASGRNVVVFYGSQTGTAEELASRLAKDATRFGMKGMPLDPEECDMEELPKLADIENGLAIFCVATYGEGDPTDNAQEFYEFLQRGDVDMTGIHYAVFGLGNKTYEHFNSMGQYTDKRLTELGAKRVYEAGVGDDDGNLEEDFMLWREGFWPAVCEFFDIRAPVGEEINTRQYRLTIHDEIEKEKTFRGEMARLNSFNVQKPPFDQKNPFLAPVVTNRELHKAGDRSCMHIEFDISGSKMRYEAGDHAAVYPTNDSVIVEKIGEILGADLNTVFTLTNVDEDSSKKHPFPCPCSYRTALYHYVDLVAPMRTNVLKELAEYCKEESEKEFLLSLSSAKDESRKRYREWIVDDRRTLLDVLTDLPSCRPPVDHLLELMPRLQPRYYSISSSPKANSDIVSITAVLVNYQTKIGRTVKGVATTYLSFKKPIGDERPSVPIFIRKSQLRLPHQSKTPVIMIGPGTGLAPFRGFLQDRFHQKKDGKEVGPTVLYFGCRRKDEDYIYGDALEAWKADGTLSELHLAFSRDGDNKVYVQHLLQKNKEATWKLIQQGAHIYVCGDAKHMSKDVHAVFVSVAVEEGKMSEEEAHNFIKKMENQKRYQADVWS